MVSQARLVRGRVKFGRQVRWQVDSVQPSGSTAGTVEGELLAVRVQYPEGVTVLQRLYDLIQVFRIFVLKISCCVILFQDTVPVTSQHWKEAPHLLLQQVREYFPSEKICTSPPALRSTGCVNIEEGLETNLDFLELT